MEVRMKRGKTQTIIIVMDIFSFFLPQNSQIVHQIWAREQET